MILSLYQNYISRHLREKLVFYEFVRVSSISVIILIVVFLLMSRVERWVQRMDAVSDVDHFGGT